MGNQEIQTVTPVQDDDINTSGLLTRREPRIQSPLSDESVTSDIIMGFQGGVQVVSFNKHSSISGASRPTKSKNRAPLSRSFQIHRSNVNRILQISTHRICTCSTDGTIRIFNMKTKKIEVEFNDHDGTIWDVVSIPCASYDKIASCGDDGTVRVYNVDYRYCERTFHDHSNCVFSMDVLSETHLISASKDGTLKITDYQYGGDSQTLELKSIPYSLAVFRKASNRRFEVIRDDLSTIYGIDDPSTGAMVAVGCENGDLLIIQPLPNGEVLEVVHTKVLVTHIQIMKDSSILSSHINGMIRHYRYDSSLKQLTLKKQYLHKVGVAVTCTCSVGEDRFVSGGENLVKLFNLKSGTCERWISVKEGKKVKSLLFLSEDIQKQRFVPSYNKTRLNFLVQESANNVSIFDEKDIPLIIRFKSGKQYCLPKSLVAIQSSMMIPDDGNEFIIEFLDYEPRVPRSLIYQILLGIDDVPLEVRDYFGLFCLFDRLGMKKSMYVICKKLESLKVLKDLFVLFLCSVECYEQENIRSFPYAGNEDPSSLVDDVLTEVEEEKSITFKSVFTMTLFNIFKSRFEDINCEHGYCRFFEKINFFDKLRKYEIGNIHTHPNLGLQKEPQFCSFYEIFTQNLVMLNSSCMYSNLLLKTHDEVARPIKAHRSVVIFKSNFFYKMMQFKGSESGSSVVLIEFLGHEELRILIQYFYLDILEDTGLKKLLKLLIHSEMYFEFQLKGLLKERILEKMTEVHEEQMIELKLLEIGYLLFRLPDIIRKDFLKLWSKKFGMRLELLQNLVEYSKRVNDELTEKDCRISHLMDARKRRRDGSSSPSSDDEEVKNENDDDDDNSSPFAKKRKIQ